MTSSHASPDASPLKVETSDKVLTLTLNRVERRNALTRQLVLDLGDALQEAAKSTARVIVLTGAGGAFCSGADLSAIGGQPGSDRVQPGSELIDEFHRLILGITEAPQPVIAAISGPAAGFGADLALACDLRIMGEDAYLEESFSKVGLMPDGGGTFFAPALLGPRAFEVLALGTRLDAKTCAALGLASRVVNPGELGEAVTQMCNELLLRAPLSLKEIKQALTAGRREALAHALAREKAGQTKLLQSEDFQEGIAAFLGKRPPNFQGK